MAHPEIVKQRKEDREKQRRRFEEDQAKRDLQKAGQLATKEKERKWLESGQPIKRGEEHKLRPTEAEVWAKLIEIRGRRLKLGETLDAKTGEIKRKKGGETA